MFMVAYLLKGADIHAYKKNIIVKRVQNLNDTKTEREHVDD